MTLHYRALDADGTVRPCGVDEWADNQRERHWVRQSDVDESRRVVTIFEGIEIVPDDVRLFGTAVCKVGVGAGGAPLFRVYSEKHHDTLAEALAYHEQTVDALKKGTTP
jgi:hypothetical protein